MFVNGDDKRSVVPYLARTGSWGPAGAILVERRPEIDYKMLGRSARRFAQLLAQRVGQPWYTFTDSVKAAHYRSRT
jgi:hypothetical protein